MIPPFPCIRHGNASTRDARLLDLVERARSLGLVETDQQISSLLDYEGQLWVTWRNDEARTAGADLVTRAWPLVGGEGGALHLVPSDEDYDYQEDCMNDASA